MNRKTLISQTQFVAAALALSVGLMLLPTAPASAAGVANLTRLAPYVVTALRVVAPAMGLINSGDSSAASTDSKIAVLLSQQRIDIVGGTITDATIAANAALLGGSTVLLLDSDQTFTLQNSNLVNQSTVGANLIVIDAAMVGVASISQIAEAIGASIDNTDIQVNVVQINSAAVGAAKIDQTFQIRGGTHLSTSLVRGNVVHLGGKPK
ncbi:MAG: hypothetical protein H6935_08890 [Thiobacillus sp.]|nr:hypothetical protein [Thiobacillus sp.]